MAQTKLSDSLKAIRSLLDIAIKEALVNEKGLAKKPTISEGSRLAIAKCNSKLFKNPRNGKR